MAKRKQKFLFSQFEVIKDGQIEDDYITFILQWKKAPRNRQKRCGSISITPSKLNFVENSVIDENIRGHGIGYKFYENVMKRLGFMSSDYHEASMAARRVWKKLSKFYFYQTNFFDGSITVYNRKKTKEKR